MYSVNKEQIRLFFIESLGIEAIVSILNKWAFQRGNAKSKEKIMEVLEKQHICGGQKQDKNT